MTSRLHEQVGAQFNQHLLSLPGAIPRPRLPMMPMPMIPGMRPPVLPTPTGAPGNNNMQNLSYIKYIVK